MKIFFVTSNSGKLSEARSILSPLGVEVESIEMELTEIQATQEHVAKHKVLEARKTAKESLVVEDTGFYMDAYNGFPGAFAAHVIRQIKPEGFLKLANGTNGKAYFVTYVAFLPRDSSEPLLFKGECHGKIAERISSAHPRLLFDSIFIPEGESRTFGEMTTMEKNKYSHRRKAFEKFASYLRENK